MGAMTLRQLEKLSANVVMLPAEDATIALSSQDIATILRDAQVQMMQPPIAPIQGQVAALASQLQIMSMREQVVVQISGNQLVFHDHSGDTSPSARLPDIVQAFVELFRSKGVQFKAYGYNFAMAFDAPGDSSAAVAILERFTDAKAIRQANISPLGAGLRLYFEEGKALSTLLLEPRIEGQLLATTSPRFFASINYHYDLTASAVALEDTLKSDFLGKWQIFTGLLERLLA